MNERECETCIKRKTMYCPNSSECFEIKDKIYYQNRIMALEYQKEKNLKLQTNWNELKKWLEENESFDDYCNETSFTSVLDKMKELE